ncbi:hypothetical protein D3C85_1302120 [compost metagenome]
MGQVGADQRDMTCAKRTDVVAGDQLAAALADQMNLEFRVMVPTSQGVGVVVFVPAKALIGRRQDDLQLGGSLFEQSGSAIRHGMPLLLLFDLRV